MAYPSHIARDALRRALRTACPDIARQLPDTIHHGKVLVNAMSLDELKAALDYLGLDPAKIAADALALNSFEEHRATNRAALRAGQDETITQEAPMISPDGYGPQSEPEPAAADAIEAEVQTIRGLIVTGGFSALDDRLRQLVTEARKPAVEIMVAAPVAVPGAPVHAAKKTGKTMTWRQLFSVTGALGRRETEIWDGTHPDTPRINDRYLWPHPESEALLVQIARGRNAMAFGPAGTGKTEWAQQLAAKTGRPFALISCDTGTDAATLVGMTVPCPDGGVTWQDGQLTKAIKTPGCVICLDEPSVARPGALFVLQNVLANRQLFIGETGTKVQVASGVIFLATDNTNGTGGGARKGYTDTNRLNAAFLDRFGVRVKFNYMPAADEAAVIVGYTGCTIELATLLVSAATVTRAAADNQTLSHGIGLRRLLAWAELLTDGISAEAAFQSAILNCASEQDVETLREQCLLAYDKAAVAKALNPSQPAPAPDPSLVNPSPAGRAAAGEFTPV